MREQNTTPEEWRPVPGWEGWHEVSNHGRVRRLRRKIGRGVKVFDSPAIQHQGLVAGYSVVHLTPGINGKGKKRVSRLVLMAFDRSPRRGEQAAHWDGDPSNNRLENLRWATAKENAADAIRHGMTKYGDEHAGSKLANHEIDEIIDARSAGHDRETVARAYGISIDYVTQVARGRARAGQSRRADRVTRRGSDHSMAVLTEDDVRAIRALYTSGLTQKQIAKRFKVCSTTVSSIIRRRTWAHA